MYKQLYRAAKAKLKLRIKVTSAPTTTTTSVEQAPAASIPELPSQKEQQPPQRYQRYSYLDTVLSSPVSNTMPKDAETPPDVSLQPLPCLQPLPAKPQQSAYALRFSQDDTANGSFCIDCNNCGRVISTDHYHCGICDDGDYDLCLACVEAGVTCSGDDHWLLKRLVQDGYIKNSTTETLPPKHVQEPTVKKSFNNVHKIGCPKKITPAFKHPAQAFCPADMRTCDACFRGMLIYALFPDMSANNRQNSPRTRW